MWSGRPTLEIDGVDTLIADDNTDDNTAGMSYVLKEEAQLAQTWSAKDQVEHDHGEREITNRLNATRLRFENLRTRIDVLWERFVTLSLDRIMSQQLREFLDELDAEAQELTQLLTGVDCEMDRIRVRIQERQRVLAQKITLLEPLAHRTSTENHLNMMLGRVEGLEAYLLGRKDVPSQSYDMHYKRHTNAPSDLLYLRVRLLTTRIAVNAANLSRRLAELDAQLAASWLDAERLKADLAPLAARIECISEQSRYWLMYLDIDSGKTDE